MSLDPITAALELGGSLIKRLFPDPAQQAEQTLKLQELAQQGKLAELQAEVSLMQGQLAVNAKEAEHPSVFVAGWRPFVGWVGGFSLAYAGILEPLMRFIASVVFDYSGDFPVIDTALTVQILLGMLGLGGLRSYDKKNGSDTSRTGK